MWWMPTANPSWVQASSSKALRVVPQTDAQGNFSISVSGNTRRNFLYRLQKLRVPTAGKSVVNVTLSDDTGQIDEVVVVGYGTVKKADLAGSVGVMDNKSFRDQPVTQITDALQGRVSVSR